MFGRLTVLTAATVLGIGAASAQDITLDPTYGSVKLTSGFAPDPYAIDVTAGGESDASKLGANCRGFVAAAPDVRLMFTPGDLPLILSVESSADTTLVVNDPGGTWICDDDSAGNLSPQIVFDAPIDGQYDIWIGTYDGGMAEAVLSISETGGATATVLDWSLPPDHGSVDLVAGFTPDPFQTPITAGGSFDAYGAADDGCYGYVNAQPDFRLNYSAGASPLVLSVTSDSDTTLIVNDPNTDWYCDDDSAGSLNPRVILNAPVSGQYDIWVGSYSGGTAGATLSISEVSPASALDYSLPPAHGEVSLVTGFTPDPYQVDIDAGGEVDAFAALGENCYGYADAAPDFRLRYTAGEEYPLILWAISDADTTLIVNAPDGTWTCDDDSGGSLNPTMTFDTPQSGQYDIWVGTYDSGAPAPATLFVSEIPGSGQTGLNWDLTPNYGEIDLAAGFAPYTLDFASGGAIDVYADLGGSCYGYASAAPDLRVFYNSDGGPAITFRVSAGQDTTLIIADPDGTYVCDDDSGGDLNPAITFDPPLAGQYDIWIGTYGAGGALADGTLTISEGAVAESGAGEPAVTEPAPAVTEPPQAAQPPAAAEPPPAVEPPAIEPPAATEPPPASGPPPAEAGQGAATDDSEVVAGGPAEGGAASPLDNTLAPESGALDLESGFTPDPRTLPVQAGGEIDVFSVLSGVAEGCAGYVTAAPAARLTYTAGALPLLVSVASAADTSLVVRGPDGTWFCDDDDGEELNPSVRIDAPLSGQYDVWVGGFTPGTTTSATLYVSEISSQ